MPPTFTPFGSRSSSPRYSPYVFQCHDSPSRMLAAGMSSTDSMSSARYSRSSGLHGANVTPQLPSTTDVTPCQHDDVATGSQPTWASRWVWTSTNPGLTTRPSASIDSRPSPSRSPTAAMRSPVTATSPRNDGRPVPSTTVPFRITRSYAMPAPLQCRCVGAYAGPKTALAPPLGRSQTYTLI